MSTARKSSQEKKPCESIAKSKPTRGSAKTPSISGHKSAARVLSTEVIPSKGDHSKSHNKAKDGSKREASPSSNQQPLDPSSAADTTAYWNAHLQAKFGKQKKAVVDKFMAIIAECIDRKLEPFEEPCDGEGCNPSSSSSRASPKSSACKKGEISSKIQSIGKKRRPCQRDDDEDSGDDQDEGDDRRNDNNKRSKTIPEAKLMYACPYYKYAPDIFGQKRTCMGPGWYELHRLKEHLNRCHKLPEFSCARCLESFAKENLLVKHQRADKACRIKEAPRNTARNLADGFNKEQADQLKKARNGPGHEKWMGWYCILFEEEDPKSPHLPSPYMGVSGGTTWREGHTSNSKYGPYLDAWRRHVLNVVRSLFETELDRKLQGLQPEIRSHVLARIPSVAESVQRIFQTDPEYSEMCKGEGHDKSSFVMPPGLDPSQLFDSFTFLDGFDSATFAQSDGFDWNLLNNDEPNLGQIYQPGSDYSSSYVSDDLNGTSQSSNTSVEDYYNSTNKVQGMQQTLALPQQSTLPHDNPYAQGYFQ